MKMISLKAQARTKDIKTNALRKSGHVPCVLYGNDTDNLSLECAIGEITKAYIVAGESTLVDLDTGSTTIPVLFHDIQFEPVTDTILHVDFYAVDMKKEIEAKVPVVLEGSAPAVKELGGVLVTTHDHVTVKCLPGNLPHNLSVNIESIVDFHTSVTVADIVVPDGVAILDDPEVVIATAQEPRSAIEETIEEEGAEGEAAEEGAEGEAKPEGDSEGEAQE